MPFQESWGDIPGFPGYQASDAGRVRNGRGKVLKQRSAVNGSRMVDIGKATAMVHHLVLKAHTGHPLFGGYRPVHLNGDLADNRLDNLAWKKGG